MAERTFTLFVVLPDESISSLRNLTSGINIEEVKARLELSAGLPSHIYILLYPDGEKLEDHQKLLMQENIKDGYVLKVQILEPWDTLYCSVSKNNIENVFHNGGVHLKGSMVINAEDSGKVESVVYDRGCVALYMASYLGLLRMCNMLFSVGININGSTQFGRTALHAAAAKDNYIILKFLIDHGAKLFCTDLFGTSPLDVAQSFSSYICEKQLKIMQLNLRGQNLRTRYSKVKYAIPVQEAKTSKEGTASHQRPKSLISVSDNKFQTLQRPRPQTYTSPRHTHTTGSARNKTAAWMSLQDSEYKKTTVISKFQGVYSGQMKDETITCKPLTLLKKKPCIKFATESDDKAVSRSTQTTPVASTLDVATTPMLFAPPSSRLTQAEENSGDEINTSLSVDERATSARTNKSTKLVSFSPNNRPPVLDFPDSSRLMKTRINLVAKRSAPTNRETSTPKRSGVVHDRWANTRKPSGKTVRPEISSSDEDDSDDFDDDSGNGSDANTEAYDSWVKRKDLERKRMPRKVTRPIHDLIKIGSTEMGDSRNPPPELNLTAYKDWLEKRKNKRVPNLERNKSMRDFMSKKKMLEEKRQKLLLNAISYSEWMDHEFDRKALIKKILKADYDQLKLMELEKMKKRSPHQISHEKWKEDVDKRDEMEKRRKEIQKNYFEEKEKWRKELLRTSVEIPPSELIRQKNGQPRVIMRSNSKGSQDNDVKRAVDADRAYQEWIRRKHSDDVSDIQRQIETEREMINDNRQRRSVRMLAC